MAEHAASWLGPGVGQAPKQSLQLVSCGTSVSEKEKQKVWAEYLGKSVIELKGIYACREYVGIKEL